MNKKDDNSGIDLNTATEVGGDIEEIISEETPYNGSDAIAILETALLKRQLMRLKVLSSKKVAANQSLNPTA